MKRPLRLIFMGTPGFAVPALNALVQSGHDVVLVCTQPDRPSGRGRKVSQSPVKQAAERSGLTVFQPPRLREDTVATRFQELGADAIVVVAYGQFLTPVILDATPLGAVNIHASLLPQLRGSAPIQWAIINRLTVTGITIMQMDAGMDTGAILHQASTPILPDDTAASLHDRLADLGASILPDTLAALASHRLTPVPQCSESATYAPLLTKKDGRINWNQSAITIEAFIRGMTPWPGAFTTDGDLRLKIFKAQPEPATATAAPGSVVSEFPGELRVATGDGVLAITEVQGASGKRMAIDAFLRGNPIPPDTQFQ